MSTTEKPGRGASETANMERFDTKLEVISLPVSDVERAKEFYVKIGWRLDDAPPGIVHLTPPGSGSSVMFGTGFTKAAPGSSQGTILTVSDIEVARDQLVAAGVDVGNFFHFSSDGTAEGLDPDRRSYFSLFSFSDPDGNTWLVQELTTRLPGRMGSGPTTYASVSDLEATLRRAEAAHGEHEKRTGQRDDNWPAWYAEYMVREQTGEGLPT
ncbi:VOC family protein [Streptomyces mirabilis]|uniref:VOC family protein n=1 Tax=Streptomyces TaxID=1883 RepID=UPI0029B7BF47|nr:VOC family protein [Streptomyces sp. AK02-04a]MDX3763821.1 glyoxalase [Streptomyces sp. AK02-04a]